MKKVTGKTPRQLWHSFLRKGHRLLRLHPSSYPYISGDTFRNAADHILDTDTRFDPYAVRKNEVVFVQSRFLETFFTEYHPRIKERYILVSHNDDENIDERYVHFIDEKLMHWFAQNCLIEHPKITPLPIGLENKWYVLHGIPAYFKTLRKRQVSKRMRIFCGFNVNTNPGERGTALKALQQHPLVDRGTGWPESFAYLNNLQQYAFVASPPGNGHDCIRTWEAMYLSTIPIVKNSYPNRYFASLGLPMLIVDNWTDISRLDDLKLTTVYTETVKKSTDAALWADYWLRAIDLKKHAQ